MGKGLAADSRGRQVGRIAYLTEGCCYTGDAAGISKAIYSLLLLQERLWHQVMKWPSREQLRLRLSRNLKDAKGFGKKNQTPYFLCIKPGQLIHPRSEDSGSQVPPVHSEEIQFHRLRLTYT